MKIKSILVASMLVGSLAMVGCQSTEEVSPVVEEPTAPVEEIAPCRDCGYVIEECKCVGYDCINCGQWHTEEESYYNEDGMSACCEQCFNEYTGQAREEYVPEVTHDIDLYCEDCLQFTGHDLVDIQVDTDLDAWYRCSVCGEEQNTHGYNAEHLNN